MKTNKSILKRIKITRNGKMLRRIGGQNHFNSKESRRLQRRKKNTRGVPHFLARAIRQRT
jgi:ribosomal protein L35